MSTHRVKMYPFRWASSSIWRWKSKTRVNLTTLLGFRSAWLIRMTKKEFNYLNKSKLPSESSAFVVRREQKRSQYIFFPVERRERNTIKLTTATASHKRKSGGYCYWFLHCLWFSHRMHSFTYEFASLTANFQPSITYSALQNHFFIKRKKNNPQFVYILNTASSHHRIKSKTDWKLIFNETELRFFVTPLTEFISIAFDISAPKRT